MRHDELGAVFAVTLAIATAPLACGDDETSPGVDAASGTSATGGSGAAAGDVAGGIGGEASGATSGTGGSGATGDSGGRSGTGGRPTGGADGSGGDGGGSGASDGGMSGSMSGGGMSGGPGGGEGGEPWSDPSTSRLERICEKTRPLGCDDYSTCLEIFRWAFFGAPHCGPVAEAMLNCLDTQATIEDFSCLNGKPFVIDRGIENPCGDYYARVGSQYCWANIIP